jgi:ATP-dependent exoDNAse (exonuclease V) alpha subunit
VIQAGDWRLLNPDDKSKMKPYMEALRNRETSLNVKLTLHLRVGDRVVLQKNLDCRHGYFNGRTGEVKKIESMGGDKQIVVWVRFDGDTEDKPITRQLMNV